MDAPQMTGRELERLRTEKGLTQAELADRLRTTGATISRWEARSVPSSRVDAVMEALSTAPAPRIQRAPAPGTPGRALAALRREAGWTQAELATRLSTAAGDRIAPGTVSAWETTSVPASRVALLEQVLGARLDAEVAAGPISDSELDDIAEDLTAEECRAALRQASVLELSRELSSRVAWLERQVPDGQAPDPRAVAILEAAGLGWPAFPPEPRTVAWEGGVADRELSRSEIRAALRLLVSDDALLKAVSAGIQRLEAALYDLGGPLDPWEERRAVGLLDALEGFEDAPAEARRALADISARRPPAPPYDGGPLF